MENLIDRKQEQSKPASPEQKRLIINRTQGERFKETDFNDLYPDQVQKDLSDVKRIKLEIGESSEREPSFGEVFESTVIALGKDSGWFGTDANVYRTAAADDILRGVDAIIELPIEEKGNLKKKKMTQPDVIALAIDSTVNVASRKIGEKISRSINKIIGPEEAPSIKYFKSESGYRGEVHNIIPVVIGLSNREADDLTRLYAEFLEVKEIKKEKRTEQERKKLAGLKNKIASHPAQAAFTEQMLMQIEMYNVILNNIQQSDTTDSLRQYIKNIRLYLEDLRFDQFETVNKEDFQRMKDDPVTQEIQANCKKFIEQYSVNIEE